MRIAVTHNLRVTGGEDEAEYDSPETIAAIESALRKPGHQVECFDVAGPASRLVTRLEAFAPDIVWNLAEGRAGRMRRGFYPALFEELGIPSTGSDAYTLCITLDKSLTKKVLSGYGVPSPRGRFLTREILRAGGLDELVYPAIAKPNFEGSSKGISPECVAADALELGVIAEDLLCRYPEGIVVERFIPGIDVRVLRLDGIEDFAPLEVVVSPSYARRHAILDYELVNKHAGLVSYRPLELARETMEKLAALASRAFDATGMKDVASLDFRLGEDGQIFLLSATGIPSFALDGPLASVSRRSPGGYDGMVLGVLRSAAKRHNLLPLLDATKARPRGRRTALRVGFAYNVKRIDSHDGDDREAEYDAPETIATIAKAIESHGHTVVPLEATPDFPRALMTSNVDIVFNIAEGIVGRNREAQVPNLCELLGIPYTGSDSATLSICLDKGLSKRLLRDVDTPAFQVLTTGREKLKSLKYPVIVKPNQEGTSKGITSKCVVDDEAGLREIARGLIERYGQPALVEEYITGREFTVGLLGERRPRVLPPMEVVFLNPSPRPVYDYTCKQDWQTHVRYECPAKLTKEELRSIERACKSTFMTLGCRDVARIDLRLATDGRVYIIEVNPLPGLTPDYSDLCLIANGCNVDYRTLIGEILSGAIKRWQTKQEPRRDASERDVTARDVARTN